MGHNMRTCPSAKKENIDDTHKCPSNKKKKKNDKVDDDDDEEKEDENKEDIKVNGRKSHYCYILQQIGKPHLCSYVGYTVNYDRRIRQHNGIIKGGARFTKNRGPWEYLVVMTCDSWNNIRGLQVEWLVKHPTRKIKRPHWIHGSAGRVRSLIEIVKRIPATEAMTMYIHPAYIEMARGLVFEAPVKFISELHF